MMDRCCRWCRYYENSTGYCRHDEMFIVEDEDIKEDIKSFDKLVAQDNDDVDSIAFIDNIAFKVINPEEFNCCYWE